MNVAEHFVQAACDGSVEGVCSLLNKGAPVDVRVERRSALDLAVTNNHKSVVRVLLDAGADTEQVVGEYQESLPLRFAATRGMKEIVHLLLAAGARPDGRLDEQQSTALAAAASQGYPEIVEDLLNYGACVNGLNTPMSNPVGSAAYSGEVGVVRLLLKRGATATNDTLHSIHSGRITAESQVAQGYLTTQQLSEKIIRYRAIAELLGHTMTQG
ncbi:ankyrin repeat domain-containing protein [Streptomyces sp. NPDC054775]